MEAVCARVVYTFDSIPPSTHFRASGPCPPPALPGFWSPHGGPCLSPPAARPPPVGPLSLFIFHPHQAPFCPFLTLPQVNSSVPLFRLPPMLGSGSSLGVQGGLSPLRFWNDDSEGRGEDYGGTQEVTLKFGRLAFMWP